MPSGQTTWSAATLIDAHLGTSPQSLFSLNQFGGGNLRRNNNASEQNYFFSNSFPRVAVNPVTGLIYIVYSDLPFAGSSVDRGDIFINEGTPNAALNGQLSWSGTRRVNNDLTGTDQWNPSVAIIPQGSKLFVGYYSRQVSAQNGLIQAFGATANLSGGFSTATFNDFPISSTTFTNLFPGTAAVTPPTSPWLFDNVWCQSLTCLDLQTARYSSASECLYQAPPDYVNFCGDDYTWTSADSGYFYFAWCDRSLPTINVFSNTFYSRADPNVRLGKIKF